MFEDHNDPSPNYDRAAIGQRRNTLPRMFHTEYSGRVVQEPTQLALSCANTVNTAAAITAGVNYIVVCGWGKFVWFGSSERFIHRLARTTYCQNFGGIPRCLASIVDSRDLAAHSSIVVLLLEFDESAASQRRIPPPFELMSASAKAFKSKGIPVFQRGDEAYERSVATPNLLFRFARPELVLQPETVAHVQAIVRQAKSQKIKLTIKCGGHSYAGHSTAFDGVSLDLRKMNKTKLNMSSKTITFDGGCQWGHVYRTLINGRHDGIGMGSDTLKEATVVTADGNLVTVKETDDKRSDKGRLFWALRGAGGGNFGVVVEMKLAVKQLRAKDGVVVAGRYQWFASEGEPALMDQDTFMPTMNKFYTTDWPERITIDSTWICDLREKSGNGVRFLTYFDGGKDDFDATIDQYIKHEKVATQLKRRSLPEKSTRFLHETLVAQWSEETVRAFPTNKTYSLYSSFVLDNKMNTIEKVTALVRDRMEAFRKAFTGEKVEFLATFIHAGAQMGAGKPTDSAYFGAMPSTTYKWMERDMRTFLGDAKKEFRPFSLNGEAAFINFPDGALQSKVHERAYFGDNRDELRRIKEIWDKDNFFQWEQGVRLPNDRSVEGDTGGPGGSAIDVGDDGDLTDSLASKQWEYYETKTLWATCRAGRSCILKNGRLTWSSKQ
ncbi:hypothetical protein BKA62DRAFT_756318 [Auriculariales sp. MPI-PUGE-AT-0066]|nr:hypothetical protein BKA62DRAFT_756318 [Auriculariales sp. MPI-PUGE-AT-0066]